MTNRRSTAGGYHPAQLIAAVLAVMGVFIGLDRVLAYDNDNLARTMADGPHRTINRLSLKKFFIGPESNALFKNYVFTDLSDLTGTGVIRPGYEHFDWKEGDRTGTFIWWIIEGGYTADEPELYASFRHFYDPSALNGAPYLTDHLDQLDHYYQWLQAAPVAGAALEVFVGRHINPAVDACSWAIEGPPSQGWGENEYCWDKGVEYMRQAFAETGPTKARLFVKAWRALGETMHLAADMALPAHVRNTSHPGRALGMCGFGNYNPNEGVLQADPYETLCRDPMILRSADGSLEPSIIDQISTAKTPRDLFTVVASYTQEHFFSANTLSGTDVNNQPVLPGNGLKPYPSPKLKPADYDKATGYYVQGINGRPIRMCHESWLAETGWGRPLHAYKLSLPCAEDQASVLIPLALAGHQKLLDWYVPKIELRIDSYDEKTGRLEGTIDIKPSPAYKTPLVYNGNQWQAFYVYVDGSVQDWSKIKVEVKANRFSADLSALGLHGKPKISVEMDIGGMRVKGAMAGEFVGTYKGTIRATRINTEVILSQGIQPGNDSTTKWKNSFYVQENQKTLYDLKSKKVDQQQPLVIGISKDRGEPEKYDLIFSFWLFGDSNDFGVFQPKEDGRFEFIKGGCHITGQLNGPTIRGTWSELSGKGAELYGGEFEAKKTGEK